MATKTKSTAIPNPTHETMMDVCPRCGGATVLQHPGDICDTCRNAETKEFPRCVTCGHLEVMHEGKRNVSCLSCLQSRVRPVCDAYVAAPPAMECGAKMRVAGLVRICTKPYGSGHDHADPEAELMMNSRPGPLFGAYDPQPMNERARGEGGRFA